MTDAPIPPTVRQRKLIRSLRQHREALKMTIEEAADQVGFSRSKLSRIETGHTRPKKADVIALLDLYGVPSPERDGLLTLAQDITKRGWWDQYDDLFSSPAFLALEDEAERITAWEPSYIPGLLQITDYARAVISRILDVDENDVHRRVVARKNRSHILERPTPVELHAIMGEAALRQQVGGPDVMRRQVAELLQASSRTTITIQVVPYSADAHPGMDGPATIFSFAEDSSLDVAHMEGQGGAVYVESGHKLEQIRLGMTKVVSSALSPEASREFIASLVG